MCEPKVKCPLNLDRSLSRREQSNLVGSKARSICIRVFRTPTIVDANIQSNSIA